MIQYQTRPGHGTTFGVVLPREFTDVAESGPRHKSCHEPRGLIQTGAQSQRWVRYIPPDGNPAWKPSIANGKWRFRNRGAYLLSDLHSGRKCILACSAAQKCLAPFSSFSFSAPQTGHAIDIVVTFMIWSRLHLAVPQLSPLDFQGLTQGA